MAGQQHGDTLVGKLAHEGGDGAGTAGVQAARRLVEQEQARGAQQCGGDAQPLTHASGIATHPTAGSLAESHAFQHLVDEARGHLAVELGQQCQVRGTGQVGIEAGLLHEPGNVVERRRSWAAQWAPEQTDRAGVGRDQAEQESQQGRLARTVGSQQTVDLSCRDDEVEFVDRRRRLKALDQTTRGDGLHARQYRARVKFSATAVATDDTA